MSEPQKPNPNFWQLHLSTATIMTVIASGMFYADVKMWTGVAEESGVPWFAVITILILQLGILAGIAFVLEAFAA